MALTSFRVAHLAIADHLTLGIAAEREAPDFTESRLECVKLSSWKEVEQSISNGTVDACFVLAPLAMHLRSKGVKLKVVLLGHREGVILTVGKNSGISSPRDLKGKTIGVPHEYSTHRLLLYKLLKSAGLSLKDVVEKKLVQSEFLTALQEGKVDAFISAEPFASIAEEAGYGRALAFSREILAHHVDCVLAVREEFIKQNSPAVQELVEALVRSALFIYENPAQASSIAEKFMGHRLASVQKLVSLDGTDLQLLSLLSTDGRAPVSKIARELGISPPGVIYRIKKLVASGVIRGFEPELDASALGLQPVKLLFSLQPRDEVELELLEQFLRSREQVQRTVRVVGEYSLEASIFVKTVSEVDALARAVGEKFPGLIKSYQPLIVYGEHWRNSPV